jgi:hypothetical protein
MASLNFPHLLWSMADQTHIRGHTKGTACHGCEMCTHEKIVLNKEYDHSMFPTAEVINYSVLFDSKEKGYQVCIF